MATTDTTTTSMTTTTTTGINSSVNLVNLDFETFKSDLKTYLKSQALFKDYDFEGSNMNVLLDILSYNTYVNAFYLNMIGNEMFLDTAQIRDSIISRAKELNYTPRSFKSAVAEVYITLTPSVNETVSTATINMPKGTSFSTRVGSNNYTFVTDQAHVIGSSNGIFVSNNLFIYEGAYIVDTFNMNYSNSAQKFVLSNPTIDTDSLTVTIVEDGGSIVLPYLRATSLFDKQSNSQIFFLQASQNDKYEIKFGDGVIGRKPKDNAIILCEYRVTKGELPNGAYIFTSDGPIGGISNVVVTTVQAASGGAVSESDESIQFNAPRYFTSQERAITADDYKNLLKLQFPEINALSVFGGEEADPPQFGKVFLAVDLKDIDGIPDIRKEQYYNFLKSRCSLAIDPVFIEPEFMYLDVQSVVRYNVNLTPASSETIKTLVLNSIKNFNSINLDDFDVFFRYSQFVSAIDKADRSIISNDTTVRAMREFVPSTNRSENYNIFFSQQLENNFAAVSNTHPSDYISTINSSVFISNKKQVFIEDDGLGNLFLKTTRGSNDVTISNIGNINYSTGQVNITNLIVDSYNGTGIKIYARTKFKDIKTSLRTLLTIRSEDINVSVITERE